MGGSGKGGSSDNQNKAGPHPAGGLSGAIARGIGTGGGPYLSHEDHCEHALQVQLVPVQSTGRWRPKAPREALM